MYGEKVRVFGEDLNVGAVLVGGTQGAIEVNVFAEGAVTVSNGKVAITAADTADGNFTAAAEGALPNGTFAKGDFIGSVTLPADIKLYAKATLTGVTGEAVVKAGYLAR